MPHKVRCASKNHMKLLQIALLYLIKYSISILLPKRFANVNPIIITHLLKRYAKIQLTLSKTCRKILFFVPGLV